MNEKEKEKKEGLIKIIMIVISMNTSALMDAVGLYKIILHLTFSIATFESLKATPQIS